MIERWMGREFATLLMACLLLAAPLGAQGQETVTPSPDPGEWVGTWMGAIQVYEPEAEDGGMYSLTISRMSDEWEISTRMAQSGDPANVSPVLGWSMDGADFSFRQLYDDVELSVAGRLEEGELRGEMLARQDTSMLGGEATVVGRARFVLRQVDLVP